MQMEMQQSRTPNIVLMSKFEASANLSGNKELKKFIDYITRKDAIKEKNEQELSQKETAELQRIEKALEKKVAFVPGRTCNIDIDEKSNCFRLNFSTMPDDKIEEGIKILAQFIKDELKRAEV